MSSRIVDARSPMSIPKKHQYSLLKFARWFLRGLVILNLSLLIISDNSLQFYHLLERAQLNRRLAFWLMGSTLLFPLAVLGEVVFCWKVLSLKWKSILLDAILVTLWFIVLWGSAVYSLFHTVWL